MRNLFLALFGFLLTWSANAQVLAITKDGQRVMLYSDGTWKFESEIDSTRRHVTTETLPAAEAPPAVMATPKPRPPRVYSLECSTLVDVERDISSDAYVAVSKPLGILKDDSTTAFSISMMKSKKGSLMWTTKIPGKPCITPENKITLVFKDGTRYSLVTDSQANCDGVFKLFFGNLDGKDIPLQTMRVTEISSVRIFTEKGFVEANFDEESAKKFKAAVNCMAKNL